MRLGYHRLIAAVNIRLSHQLLEVLHGKRQTSPSHFTELQGAVTQMHLLLFSPFASAMPLDPIQNQGVGLFRRLPEETVRLPFQNLKLRAGDALH
jgi:hypothetical protein